MMPAFAKHNAHDGQSFETARRAGRPLVKVGSPPSLTALQSPDRPGPIYDRPPEHSDILRDVDVMVPMRDGVQICADIYRPRAPGKFPALLAFAIYNKDLQGPDLAEALPPQPAWSPLWTGPMEAGDTRFLVSRGYVHVIGSPRRRAQWRSGGAPP